MDDEHRAHKARLREAKEKSANRKTAHLAQPSSQPKSFFDIPEEEEILMSKNGGSMLWKAILDRISREKGEVLVATLMGSSRYNLQVNGSDMDLVIVYVPPLDDNIGINPQPQTFKQIDNCRPDFSVHSLAHFCILLSEGDAKSIEVLFCHPSIDYYIDEDWAQLRAIKSRFVTKRFIRNYIGEIQGSKGLKKLKRLIDDGSDLKDTNKCAYLLMRLILLCQRFIRAFETNTLNTSNPTWFEDETPDHKMLMSIRRGEIDPLKLQEMILKEFDSLEPNLASSGLPDSLNPSFLTDLDQWYLLFCQSRYKISLEPILRPLSPSLTKFDIPGQLLCLYRSPADDSIFGVYSQHLRNKLSIQSSKESIGVVNGSIVNINLHSSDSSTSNEKHPQQYVLYEMDRLIDAIKRDELTTVITIHNNSDRIYGSSTWNHIDDLLPLLWTNSLIYQLCGYISGRFKACRGDVNLMRSEKTGFSSSTSLSVCQFACKLLFFALSNESPRPISSSKAREDIEDLLKSIRTISTISASLLDQTATPEQMNALVSISQTYTKSFIAIRPTFSELLWPEIQINQLNPWFLSCRLESLNPNSLQT